MTEERVNLLESIGFNCLSRAKSDKGEDTREAVRQCPAVTEKREHDSTNWCRQDWGYRLILKIQIIEVSTRSQVTDDRNIPFMRFHLRDFVRELKSTSNAISTTYVSRKRFAAIICLGPSYSNIFASLNENTLQLVSPTQHLASENQVFLAIIVWITIIENSFKWPPGNKSELRTSLKQDAEAAGTNWEEGVHWCCMYLRSSQNDQKNPSSYKPWSWFVRWFHIVNNALGHLRLGTRRNSRSIETSTCSAVSICVRTLE